MNWHKEGDELEHICRQELLRRWPGSEIIETKLDSIHGIDFAVRIRGGGIAIVEVKSGTGSVRNQQMTPEWITQRLGADLEKQIIEAFLLERPVFRATYRVRRETNGLQVSSASPTGELTWEMLFGNRPRPLKNSVTLVGKHAHISGEFLLVVHEMRASHLSHAVRQTHEYRLKLCQLSAALVDSTLSYQSFPFRVPHSHRIIENGRETYDRSLEEWSEHLAANEEGLASDKVEYKLCMECSAGFYDTSEHRRCYPCFQISLVRNKKLAERLIAQATELARKIDVKGMADQVKALQQEWKQTAPLPREDADQLWQAFNTACQNFFSARQAAFAEQEKQRQNNRQRAENLISQARNLSRSREWKETGEAIRQLQQEWKEVHPLPKDDADALWQRFNTACQSFFDARQAAFAEQEKQRQNNRQRAENLISQARSLSRSREWKEAGEAIRQLQQEWKEVHPLPKDDADALWQRFNTACQSFFDARQAAFAEQERQRQNNRRAALNLISRAERILADADWKNGVEEIKGLQSEWRHVHPLPSADADSLWRQFNDVCQTFFVRKKQMVQQAQDEWRTRTRQALARAQEAREAIYASIAHDAEVIARWENTINNLRPGGRANDIRGELQSKIHLVEQKIDSKRQKIADIDASICDMQQRLSR